MFGAPTPKLNSTLTSTNLKSNLCAHSAVSAEFGSARKYRHRTELALHHLRTARPLGSDNVSPESWAIGNPKNEESHSNRGQRAKLSSAIDHAQPVISATLDVGRTKL